MSDRRPSRPDPRTQVVGDPIALVVAPTQRDAHRCLLVEVSYEEGVPVYGELEALAAASPLVHARHFTSDSDSAYFDMRPQDGTNVCHRFRIRTPSLQGRDELPVVASLDDDDEALADLFEGAEVVIDEVFYTPAAAHVPMEPHATTAQWVGDRLEVVTGTQTPFNMRQDLQRSSGWPQTTCASSCPRWAGRLEPRPSSARRRSPPLRHASFDAPSDALDQVLN